MTTAPLSVLLGRRQARTVVLEAPLASGSMRDTLGEDGSLIGPIWTKTDFSSTKDCILPARRSPVTNGTFGSFAANQAHFTDSGLLILPCPVNLNSWWIR